MADLITVYIPTFNRAELLHRAVRSVLHQTYPTVEILVVDDHSDAPTSQALEELARNNPIRLLKNEGAKGACGARNTALKYATGEYITGLDDDDQFQPRRLEQLLAAFKETPCSCVTSTVSVRDAFGEFVRNADTGLITLAALLHYNKIGSQVLTRTDWMRAIGGFDERMPAFQDYDTWVRLVARYGPARKIAPASYLIHLDHDNERISSSFERRARALNLFMEKHATLLEPQHIRSLQLLERKVSGKGIGFFELVRFTSRDNWKSAVSLFLDHRFRSLMNTARRIKSSLRG